MDTYTAPTKPIILPSHASSNIVMSAIEQKVRIGDTDWFIMFHYDEGGSQFKWAIEDRLDGDWNKATLRKGNLFAPLRTITKNTQNDRTRYYKDLHYRYL